MFKHLLYLKYKGGAIMDYETMKHNEEEYQEWEMKQPGFWKDQFIMFVILAGFFSAVYLAYIGLTA